jgi:choline dehydrogenase-like flavoprotein
MIHDFQKPGSTLPSAEDATVVVGAGAAGIALALALGDAGERVLLLESGGDSKDPDSERDAAHLNEAVITGLPLDGVVNGRARVVGGTTALWHGQCMRLHPIDIEQRPWVPHSGWPLAASALDQHYPAAERFLDVSGRGYGAQRWTEHASLEPLAWTAERLLHDFTEYTPRPHLGQVHRDRLARHPQIELVLHATVGGVLVEQQRVRGVELRAAGREPTVLRCRRVVLAGGAIENARMLMLSDPAGIGLGIGRAHTGRWYQDHPIIRTAEVVARDWRVLQDRYIALHRQGRRLFPKVRLAPEAQRQHGLLDATAVFIHDHDDPAREALRRLIIAARHGRRPEHPLQDALRGLGAPLSVLRDVYRRYAKGMATGTAPTAVWLQVWVEQQPDPNSRITLDVQRDQLGLPQARLHWTCSELELHTSRTLTHWVAEDLRRLQLAELRKLPSMHDDEAWRATVGDAAHPAGTTRMAREPHAGVVDPQLAVHGLSGLHVVGSSVFPTCGYANPTLTIVALALRLAEHLRSRVEA